MTRPISMDLRERAMERLDRGQTVRDVAAVQDRRQVRLPDRLECGSPGRVFIQNKALRPTERLRADVARRRDRWKCHRKWIDPNRFVFINETWAKTNMAPLGGWAPEG